MLSPTRRCQQGKLVALLHNVVFPHVFMIYGKPYDRAELGNGRVAGGKLIEQIARPGRPWRVDLKVSAPEPICQYGKEMYSPGHGLRSQRLWSCTRCYSKRMTRIGSMRAAKLAGI